MATYGSPNVGFLLIGGRDILAVSTGAAPSVEAETRELTPLGATWPTHVLNGLKSGTFTQEGWYDDAAGSINDAVCEKEGTSQVVCIGHEGNTIGKKFWGFAGVLAAKFKRLLQVGEFHKASFEGSVTGAAEVGMVVASLAARTTAGNTQTTPVNNGASSANGGAGYLQVNALTLGGYTNCVVKGRHSSDNVTYADLLTFTVVTTAPTAERVTCVGTVNQYLAMSWAWTGSGSGMSITCMVGFARG